MTLVVKRRTVTKPVKTTQGENTEMTVVEGTDPSQQLPPGVTINVNPENSPPPQISAELQAFFDQRVEAVRKEEKDKLYPELERQKQLIDELAAERDAREAAAQEDQQAQEAAEEQRRQSELTAEQRWEERDRQWEERLRQMEEDRNREAALREREAQFAQLNQYRTEAIAAASDRIEPRLIPYIRGNTPQEIDAAVAQAVTDTDAIMADVQESFGQQRRQVQMPVSGIPSEPVASLLNNPGDRTVTLSPEDIRNMPMDDYMANRHQILEAARQRGPYG
jgi:hypothetical protein